MISTEKGSVLRQLQIECKAVRGCGNFGEMTLVPRRSKTRSSCYASVVRNVWHAFFDQQARVK